MSVVVLGIDGLDRHTLECHESSLQTIRSLADQGIETSLEATHSPASESVWPSLYTGTDPSHHGSFGSTAIDRYPDGGKPVSRVDVRRPALWEYLSSEGGAAVVMNVPVTHPADPLNGVIVPGSPAPDDEPGYPDGIRATIHETTGPPPRAPPSLEGDASSDSDSSDHRARAIDLVDHRREAFTGVLADHEWELAVCRVQGIDAFYGVGDGVSEESEDQGAGERESGHRRDDYQYDGEPTEDAIYNAVDRLVEAVLEAVDDETTVVVCSTHGIATATGYEIGLNDLLADYGYVETTTPTDDPTAVSVRRSETLPVRADPRPTQSLLERARRGGRHIVSTITDRRVLATIANRLGLEGRRLNPFSQPTPEPEIDWRESLAYCASGDRLGVRINRAGREPNGQVPPSTDQLVSGDLVDVLSSLETPDGKRAFETVCPREQVYDGPFLENAPDILLRPATGNTVSAALTGQSFRSIESTTRTDEGLIVASGPQVAGWSPRQLSVTDVAPMVMTMLERPVPSLMTGAVPDGVTPDRSRCAEYRNVAIGATTSDPEFDDGDIPACLDGIDSWHW